MQYTFSDSTIAHILARQPNNKLDCTGLNIILDDHRQWGAVHVRTLHLLQTQDPSFSTEQELLMAVSFTPEDGGGPDTLYISPTDPELTFQVHTSEPDTHPLIQAVPKTFLYHESHPLHLTHLIPIEPPYSCTLEETRELIHSHIPDLPKDLCLQWILSLTVSVIPTWPTSLSDPYAFEHRKYTSSEYPEADETGVVEAYTYPISFRAKRPVPKSAGTYQPLYELRNQLILSYIFPHLASLCPWVFRSTCSHCSETLPVSADAITTLPPNVAVSQLIGLPTLTVTHLWHKANAPQTVLTSHFPTSTNQPPPHPDPAHTPAEILQRSAADIATAQLQLLLC